MPYNTLTVHVVDADTKQKIPGARLWCLFEPEQPDIPVPLTASTNEQGKALLAPWLQRQDPAGPKPAGTAKPPRPSAGDVFKVLTDLISGKQVTRKDFEGIGIHGVFGADTGHILVIAHGYRCGIASAVNETEELTIALKREDVAVRPASGALSPVYSYNSYTKAGEFLATGSTMAIADGAAPDNDVLEETEQRLVALTHALEIQFAGDEIILLGNIGRGLWTVFYRASPKTNGGLDELLAVHEDCRADIARLHALDWDLLPDSPSNNLNTIGIYDSAHYNDDSIVPRDYEGEEDGNISLWGAYNMSMSNPVKAEIIPYGVVSARDHAVLIMTGRDSETVLRAVLLKFV
ncbi:MAG: hypothetical protein ACAI35_23050 [Candidatus Methylacidiphilales bacterium]|nr:hypothetical protein [Candidatus Methylacidiphilales bacterium]